MSQISRLKPVALAEQVAALADLNEFDDALQLSTLLPDEERQSVEDVLRARLCSVHSFCGIQPKTIISCLPYPLWWLTVCLKGVGSVG